MKEFIGAICGIGGLVIGSIVGAKVASDMEGGSAVICTFIGAIIGGGIGGWFYSIITNSSSQNSHQTIGVKQTKSEQPSNLYEQVKEVATPLIINSYRKVASQRGIAPTSKTSDSKIIELYSKVTSAFKEASKQRSEHIPAYYTNFIVLKFFQIYEIGGDEFLDEHLRYEVDKYLREGLRSDYKQELKVF